MKTYIQLLYKSFFDTAFIKNYIRNGKGSGAGMLCIPALILAICVTAQITFVFSSISREDVREATQVFFEKAPEIVIKNGELQWRDGVIDRFELDEDITIIVDTRNANPSLKQVKDSVIYMTKTDVYFNDDSNNRIQPVSYKD
ncbi:MAG: DUF1189 domain-containing protein, partial [Lactobacillus sp.]|nr:DUF1189 domain-containing protein [Lactobacillus sp.]